MNYEISLYYNNYQEILIYNFKFLYFTFIINNYYLLIIQWL